MSNAKYEFISFYYTTNSVPVLRKSKRAADEEEWILLCPIPYPSPVRMTTFGAAVHSDVCARMTVIPLRFAVA